MNKETTEYRATLLPLALPQEPPEDVRGTPPSGRSRQGSAAPLSPAARSRAVGSPVPSMQRGSKDPSTPLSVSSSLTNSVAANIPAKPNPRSALLQTKSMGPPFQKLKRVLSDESIAQGQPRPQRPLQSPTELVATRRSRFTITSEKIFSEKDKAILALEKHMIEHGLLIPPSLAEQVAEARALGKDNNVDDAQNSDPVDHEERVNNWLSETPENDAALSDEISSGSLNRQKDQDSTNRPRYVQNIRNMGNWSITLDEYCDLLRIGDSKLAGIPSGLVGAVWPRQSGILQPYPKRAIYECTPSKTLIPFVPNGLTSATTWIRVNDAVRRYQSPPIQPTSSYATRLEARLAARADNERRLQEITRERAAKRANNAKKAAQNKAKTASGEDSRKGS
ncbi:hypothetical protein MY10362_000909 [Beauveria mimosiformis]